MEALLENKQIVLGLTGVARCGKDTFCELASEILIEDYGLVAQRYALADELKNDINPFLKEKCGIDVWKCTPEEKEMIRPLLLYYGTDIKRKQTKGRYWVDKLSHTMNKDKLSDVMIVTDVRYGVEDADELHWLKKEMGGKLIYVAQYTIDNLNKKTYLAAENPYEKRNDPIMKQNADCFFEWRFSEHRGGGMNRDALKLKVKSFLNTLTWK